MHRFRVYVRGLNLLDELVLASRAASKALRAALKAEHLISRSIVAQSRELKALVLASQVIERARRPDRRSPSAPPKVQRRSDMKREPGVKD